MRNKRFRIPDKLPKLRTLPQVGDLVAIQDLDATVFPVIVLQIEFTTTKKGKTTKRLKTIHVLQGNNIRQVMLSDLKLLK